MGEMEQVYAFKDRIALLEAELEKYMRVEEISLKLNYARDEEEIMRVLTQMAWESGAIITSLLYVDLNEAGEPEWLEIVASRHRESVTTLPVGIRFYVPDYPAIQTWLVDPDEPLLVSDVQIDERLDEPTRDLLLRKEEIRALATLPLAQAGNWCGLVVIRWQEPHSFTPQEESIYRAISVLAAPITANRRLLNGLELEVRERTREMRESREAARASEEQLRSTMDAMRDSLYVIDADYRVLLYNQEMGRHLQRWRGVDDPVGKNLFEVFPAYEKYRGDYERVFETGEPLELRRDVTQGDQIIHLESQYIPVGNGDEVSRIIVITQDVSERVAAEHERERLQQEVIKAQQQALRELSMPIIPVMDQIIVMPLIGTLDPVRAQEAMRALLWGIGRYRAKIVILDVTGVPNIGVDVAAHLNKAVGAARLKGTRTIITGISDTVAETLVDLGIDWSGVETLRDLQTGLVMALAKMGYLLRQK